MTKSWQKIIERYAAYEDDWRSIHALENLARRISETALAGGLLAWTSMFDLCIVQTAVSYPYEGPCLRLSPVSEDKVEFIYEDTHAKARQWRRTVDADDVLPRLFKFLDQLRWFPADVLKSLGDTVG